MRRSTRTCRLQGLRSDVTEDRLNQLAEDLCAKPRGLKTSVKASLNSVSQTFGLSHGDQSPVILGTNLTIRDNVQTATITYNSQTKKQRATKSFRPSNECANVDDEFEGVTVLYGGNEMPIDLDICAVHGLDGHAFDTWMAKTKMWLRDYLPHEFPKSRIMTFGYNSNLMDGKSINHGLKDFADSLIDGLKFVRASDDEQRRPVLFICHSMGGFVSRLAVTRHWRWRGEGMKYKSVKFVNYGFLFLSTPHSGTNLADFSDLALDFASLMAGVRTKLVEELKVFNPSFQEVINDWQTIKPQPIVRCLCETNLTKTTVGDKQIVTAVSAGFMGITAEPVPGTDHNSVCRFETKFDKGYAKVLDTIKELRNELLEQSAEVVERPSNVYMPGHIPISAPSFPPQNKLFFYNEISRQPSVGFVGRNALLNEIRRHLEDNYKVSKIALTGMAGAGKTEVLLQLADEYSSSHSVFILPSSGDQDLRGAVQDVAIMIGHDLMDGNTRQGFQLQHWNSLSPEILERMFMKWVDRGARFHPCIVVLDDLHGLDEEHHRSNIAFGNTTVLISARDPVEAKKMGFMIKPVSSLDLDDMLSLFKRRANEAGLSSVSHAQHDEQLKLLAYNLDSHAFGVCVASTAIYFLGLEKPLLPDEHLLQYLIDTLQRSGSEVYERLLSVELQEHGSRSIMKLYESSLERLRDCSKSQVPDLMNLLELMAFLQPAPFFTNMRQKIDIFDFLSKVNGHIDDITSSHPHLRLSNVFRRQSGEILHAFEKTSLGIRVGRSILIPALWRACVLQTCTDERREFWLRQILLVCFHIGRARNVGECEPLAPYTENCLRIANRFNIYYERLLLAGEEQLSWIKQTIQRPEDVKYQELDSSSPGTTLIQ